MPARFRLIVGLGNPTVAYEKTRHNAGFWFLDEIAGRMRVNFSTDSRSRGLLAKLEYDGDTVLLLKPMQYMNRSGGGVSALAHFFKIPPAQVLVAHDELDFAAGVVRLKNGGGHGGHNGLRDIVAKLGSTEFCRLRIGIGRPGNRDDVVDYVLTRPTSHEDGLVRAAIARATDFLPDLLAGRLDAVMNALHT